ncbi:cofactor-independent phosphoglycerate mutase [Muribaculaceae bacterium Isolate-002 (NCI)]|nr:cofactor-independent phosphoglycerate mutase [Muribaculaceae bacterium Isolate-002 (NCI)]
MKHIIILGDGMADDPIVALDGQTPLQYAVTPGFDFLAKHGVNGTLCTVPGGFSPGSEIANLGVLGYDVNKVYEGRGSLEAASMGVDIADDEVAMRCNLICVENGKIKNHSAGHISTEEASELIEALQKELGSDTVSFHCGVSYRHLLKIRGGRKDVQCTPPHDVPGVDIDGALPKALSENAQPTCDLLVDLIRRSYDILMTHPVNRRRMEIGKDPANMIWPWSLGYRPSMLPLSDLYGIKKGAVISAVDLIKGIGRYAGLDVIEVEGATGLYDTNYEGKAEAAIEALRGDYDLVFLHVEASDEAGHEGDVDLKIRTIEYLDKRIVQPIINAVKDMEEPVAIALLPDHPTPCHLKTHTSNPVPFVIWHAGIEPDSVVFFDEQSACHGAYGYRTVLEFMPLLLNS